MNNVEQFYDKLLKEIRDNTANGGDLDIPDYSDKLDAIESAIIANTDKIQDLIDVMTPEDPEEPEDPEGGEA